LVSGEAAIGFLGIQQDQQEEDYSGHTFEHGQRSIWSAEFVRTIVHDDLGELACTLQVDEVVRVLVEMKNGHRIPRDAMANAEPFGQDSALPSHIGALFGCFQVNIRMEYLWKFN
jgi:hypothetical protein